LSRRVGRRSAPHEKCRKSGYCVPTSHAGCRRRIPFLFGFLTVVAAVYFAARVPETKGMRLEEITAQAEGRRVQPDRARQQQAR
jgi:hypothetical protein